MMLLKSFEGKTVIINGSEFIIDEMISTERAKVVKMRDGVVAYSKPFWNGEVLQALGVSPSEITYARPIVMKSVTTLRAKQAQREIAEKMRQFYIDTEAGYVTYNKTLAPTQ